MQPAFRIVMMLALGVLAGCSVPRGAAFQGEILRAAEGETPDFGVQPVTRATLGLLTGWPVTGGRELPWPRQQDQPTGSLVAPGDDITVTVWDTNENSLLNSPGQKVVELQSVRVSPAGRIFLPYVGEIALSGMSAERARERVEEAFVDAIPTAQVQLSVVAGRGNMVSLVGGVTAPGAYELTGRSFSVLDLLSMGGGVAASLINPQIRIFRGDEVYGTSIAQLFDTPARDIALQGGDRVIVEEDERYFLSLGASSSEAIHVFPKDQVTALDALSIIGGVQDDRADPQAVLVLREYPVAALRGDGSGPSHDRMVFTIDLTSTDGLFSAGRFKIMPGDLVYATESPITGARSILGLIGASLGVANQVSN